jgi:hypothetical protein
VRTQKMAKAQKEKKNKIFKGGQNTKVWHIKIFKMLCGVQKCYFHSNLTRGVKVVFSFLEKL